MTDAAFHKELARANALEKQLADATARAEEWKRKATDCLESLNDALATRKENSPTAPAPTETPAGPREPCMHMDFEAECRVTRLEDTGTFVVDLEVNCRVCGESFRFLKLPPGISTVNPCVNIDGTTATLPIEPEGQKKFFDCMTVQMPKLPEKA